MRLYENVLADYADVPTKKERMKRLREDPYYNALQIKYAYAVTCHKAQGADSGAVFSLTRATSLQKWAARLICAGFIPLSPAPPTGFISSIGPKNKKNWWRTRIWNRNSYGRFRVSREYSPEIKENHGCEGSKLFFLKKNQKNLVKSLEV